MIAIKVKDYLANLIDAATQHGGKTQRDIATALGYDKPNMISMIKTGAVRLPINKIGPLAQAVGVDPLHLLRIVMKEYSPDTWAVLERFMHGQLVSDNELEFLQILRAEAGGGADIVPRTNEEFVALSKLVALIRERQRTGAGSKKSV